MIRPLPRPAACLSLPVLLGVGLLTALAFIAPTAPTASAHQHYFTQNSPDILTFAPGQFIERRLASGATHHYRLALGPHEFLRLVIERTAMDVTMMAGTPGGEEVTGIDDCYATGGWQSLLLLAEQPGDYHLQIRSIKQGQGTYRLRIVERRAALAGDQDCLRAQRLAAEAQQLYRLERAAERQRAIAKLAEAVSIFQALADNNGTAHALSNLGGLHSLLGEKRQALSDYQRALQLYRAAANRQGEATTLIRLGSTHNQLGEKQQATTERRYYLSRRAVAAARFAAAVRTHWSIEKSCHWILDGAFREDECRVRTGFAAENLGLVRRLALSLRHPEKSLKVGIQIKRLTAGWDHKYLLKVLNGKIINI